MLIFNRQIGEALSREQYIESPEKAKTDLAKR